jgi:hypothetical protein
VGLTSLAMSVSNCGCWSSHADMAVSSRRTSAPSMEMAWPHRDRQRRDIQAHQTSIRDIETDHPERCGQHCIAATDDCTCKLQRVHLDRRLEVAAIGVELSGRSVRACELSVFGGHRPRCAQIGRADVPDGRRRPVRNRSNSRAPNSRSGAAMLRDRAGCVIRTTFAAPAKLRVRAKAKACCIWVRSRITVRGHQTAPARCAA